MSPAKRMPCTSANGLWCLAMRVISLVMAFQLFVLPQMVNSQRAVAVMEERSPQPPPIIEEEVLKHAIRFSGMPSAMPALAQVTQFHQHTEMMLDHPLREVPHLPPRS